MRIRETDRALRGHRGLVLREGSLSRTGQELQSRDQSQSPQPGAKEYEKYLPACGAEPSLREQARGCYQSLLSGNRQGNSSTSPVLGEGGSIVDSVGQHSCLRILRKLQRKHRIKGETQVLRAGSGVQSGNCKP